MASRQTVPRLLPRIGAFVVLGTLIGVVIFGSRGALHLRALKREQAQVQGRITRLLAHNAGLRERLQQIRTDDRHLEQLVRAQLGFVRPGELVYRFAPTDSRR